MTYSGSYAWVGEDCTFDQNSAGTGGALAVVNSGFFYVNLMTSEFEDNVAT